MSECDESNLQNSVNLNRKCVLEDRLTYSQNQFGYSNLAMSYEEFDIVGESFDHRFPWQRDISVQCCLDNNSFKGNLTGSRNSTAPVWNSYLPRERSASLTRGEIPSLPVGPRSAGCLSTCSEEEKSTSYAKLYNRDR